jgi:hypothetical protein
MLHFKNCFVTALFGMRLVRCPRNDGSTSEKSNAPLVILALLVGANVSVAKQNLMFWGLAV